MKNLIPLMIMILLASLLLGCANEGEDEATADDAVSTGKYLDLIKLVPQKSNVIGYIDVARILDDEDIVELYAEMPKEEGEPATIDAALEEIGIDFEDALLFGDFSEMPDLDGLMVRPNADEAPDVPDEIEYFGFIVNGSFNQKELFNYIDNEEDLTTISYKDHMIFTDSTEEIAISFLSDATVVIGSMQATKDVITIKEGDKSAIKGGVMDLYNSLGDAMFKLAMEVPAGLMQEDLPEDSDEMDMGMMGLDLAVLEEMEAIGITVDKKGDSIPIVVQICFSSKESANEVKTMIGFLTGMMSGGMGDSEENNAMSELIEDLSIEVDGSCIDIGLELTVDMVKELMESSADSVESDWDDDDLDVDWSGDWEEGI